MKRRMRRPIGLLALVVPACAAIVLLVLASTGRVPLGHAGTSNGLIVDTMAEERVTPADLAEILLGYPPPGPIGIAGGQIPYSNVTYSGGATGAGAFSGGDGIIGFDAGVVLGSGDVEGVIGPNTALDFSWTTGGAGDADLDAIVSPSTTFDAAVLEFDFVPAGDTIQFRYVFASEEYNFWVHAEFNDVFGFFVNGVNCATVEGDPVSVNTINNGNPFGTDPREHPELYINNDLDDGGGSINTGMNGLTVVLTCFASVTPGETNHIKLAIADAGDFALDSNVFLEGGSFSVVPTATPAAPATPTVPPTVTPTPLPATGTPPPATNTPPPTATATAAPPTNTPPLPTATRTPTLGPPTATRTPTSLPTPTRTPTPSPVPPTNTRPPQPPTPIPPTAPPSATPLPPTATSVSGVLGGGGTIVTPDITNTPTARATPTPRTRPTPTPVSDVLGGTGDPPADPDPPTIARPPIGTGHDGVVPPETTRSILTPGGLSTDPAVIGTNVILAIILLIVLLASSEIFNTTIDENRDKVANFFNRVLAPFRRLAVDLAESPLGGNAALPLLLMVGVPAFVLGLTGLIYTFTEPSLGWNSETLLLFVSVVIAMGIVTYVYEGGQAVFSRLTFGRDAGVRVFPAAIGIAVAFVVFSRVSSFEVPIIYGFVASVALLAPAALDRREEGQTILVPAAVLLSLSLLAWVLIDPLRDLSDGETAWWRYLPGETSALIFAEGVEGLVFVMIPLRFMDGAKVASWNKLLWVPIMGIPLFVFSWVMLNPNAQEFDVLLHGRVRAVIALAGGYAAITLGTWLFFALRARRDAPLDLAPITTTPGGTASTAPIASFPLRSEPPAQVQPPERPDLSRRRDDLSRRRDDS